MITEDSIKQFPIFMFYFCATRLTSGITLQCYHFSIMKRAAFVLAGGKSSRMGRDKALLPFKGRPLVELIATQACAAAGNITLIGDPGRYTYRGYPVVEDILSGCGPLAGIYTALTVTQAEWNLIVACDMPEVTAEFLARLMDRAEAGGADAVLPVSSDGLPQPLCAAYRRRCADAIGRALAQGIRKVTDGLVTLELDLWRVPHSPYFRNLNTALEWARYSHD